MIPSKIIDVIVSGTMFVFAAVAAFKTGKKV